MDEERVDILRIAIREFCRQQGGKNFYPSAVVQWLYPESWPYFLEEIDQKAREMHRRGDLTLMEEGRLLAQDENPSGRYVIKPISYR